ALTAASEPGQFVRLEAHSEKSWSVVPIVASRPSKMLLMHGNVAFAAHDRDRPESDDFCSELRNGINAGSNICDFPALSRMKTTVRKCFEGSKARCWFAARSLASGARLCVAASSKTSGTRPRAILRPFLTRLPLPRKRRKTQTRPRRGDRESIGGRSFDRST